MLFGRTLYGGALYPRQVTAGGSIAASASASAQPLVTRPTGAVVSASAQLAGGAVRNVLPGLFPGLAASACLVQARGEFRPGALVSASVTLTGVWRGNFAGFGEAFGIASDQSVPRRTARIIPPVRATATAQPEADGAVYVLADVEPVEARAHPFGTHWYVGRGESLAAVVPTADAQALRAVSGVSPCQGVLAGTAAAYLFGGAYAEVSCDLDSDPLVTSQGVRYWSGRGVATAVPHLGAVPYIYTVALAVGRALPMSSPNAHKAARGTALARMGGSAEGQRVIPQDATVVVGAQATGTVAASRITSGRVAVSAAGGGTALPAAWRPSRGATTGRALPQAAWIQISVLVRPSLVAASGLAALRSDRRGASTVAAFCAIRVAGRKRAAAFGDTDPHAWLVAEAIFHPKQLVSGAAYAVAELSGFNRINDAQQLLTRRAVTVGRATRSLTINAASRTVMVSGTARRLAA